MKCLSIGALLLLGSVMTAGAQDINCDNPTTQVEMTGCAALDFEAADASLNTAYRNAVQAAKEMDGYVPGLEPTHEEMLRDAQRTWIPFRDAACAAESNIARGGTLQNQLFFMCLTRLTEQRTDDLWFFTEGMTGG